MTTVAEQLDELEERRCELRSTLCAGCRHEYHAHTGEEGNRSFPPLCKPFKEVGQYKWRAVLCKCVRFVDPSETLLFDPTTVSEASAVCGEAIATSQEQK